MKSFLKDKYQLLLIFLASFLLFYPSLFVFFTNDDFFFLKISNIGSLPQFFNFFSLTKGPDGFGMYRPLTTQVFYFLDRAFFGLNPIGLHVIAFLVFFGLLYLVYVLANLLLADKKIAVFTALLYSLSATHFGHLYYLATFQELGMTFFVLLSCIFFVNKKLFLSILFFVLALLSKETAVVTPVLIGFIFWFFAKNKKTKFDLKPLLRKLAPFFIILFIYFLFRVFSYGFAKGDTYIWDFSIKRLANTVFWYLVWSLNLPETLLDFVGPGFSVNPNLFIYWSKQIIPIFAFFALECIGLVVMLFKTIRSRVTDEIKQNNLVSSLSIFWFLVALLPVIFLPEHKFTFYLTLPLFAVAFRIAYLLVKSRLGDIFVGIFVVSWAVTSILTVKHTVNTNWITQGEKISQTAYKFISGKTGEIGDRKVVFADTINDATLPWSPTTVVKTALSANNFFEVYFPKFAGNVDFGYSGQIPKDKSYIIISRTLLGY